jgi:hypothetical protein
VLVLSHAFGLLALSECFEQSKDSAAVVAATLSSVSDLARRMRPHRRFLQPRPPAEPRAWLRRVLPPGEQNTVVRTNLELVERVLG